MQTAIQELETLIKARYPIVYILSDERERTVFHTLHTTFAKEAAARRIYSWDIVDGFHRKTYDGATERSESVPEENPRTIVGAMDWILEQKASESALYILCEAHHELDSPAVQRRLRLFVERVASEQRKSIILLSTQNDGCRSNGRLIPTELDNIVYLMHWPYPDKAEIRSMIEDSILPEFNGRLKAMGRRQIELAESEMSRVVDACRGMTMLQIENAISKSFVRGVSLDAAEIGREKKQIVEKSGLCDYVEPAEGMADIGGLDNLKGWLALRKGTMSEEAAAFGCDPPLGVVLVGPWGAGKSLAAKAIINEFGLPGIRIDASRLFNQWVGSSERQTRQILSLVEGVSPCLAGDTMIEDGDGYSLEIAEIFSRGEPCGAGGLDCDVRAVRGMTVVSMTDLGHFKPVKVKFATRRKVSSLVETFVSGISTTSTIDHLFAVLARNGKIGWKESLALVPQGDSLPTPFYVRPGNPLSLFDPSFYLDGMEEDCAGGYFLRSSINEKCFIRHRSVFLPEKMCSDLACLMGLIHSDGYILRDRKGFGFINADEVLLARFHSLCERLFGEDLIPCRTTTLPLDVREETRAFMSLGAHSEMKPCHSIKYCSGIVGYFLFRVAQEIERLCGDHVRSYLGGYLDGDGSVRGGVSPLISFCQKKSMKRNFLLRKFLSRIGIPCGIRKGGVEVSSKSDCRRLAELILPYVWKRSKRERLQIISKIDISSKGTTSPRRDSVFVPDLLKRLKKHVPDNVVKISKKIGGNFSEYAGGKPIPRFRLERILSAYGDDLPDDIKRDILFVCDRRIFYSTVTKSVQFKKDSFVYDLVCEDDSEVSQRNFVANGFVVHNCILWLDEAENLLATGTGGDGGTASRVVGIISTWLSERKGVVFCVFTANDISQSPPKMFRKGRVDEIFVVDLPTVAEREEILRIHVRSRLRRQGNKDAETGMDLAEVASACRGFSGAEIKTCVDSAVRKCFQEGRRPLVAGDLLEEIGSTYPMSCTMSEQIKKIREWQNGRAVPASKYKPEALGEMSSYHKKGAFRQIDL